MELTRGTTAKAVLYFVALISLLSGRALSEDVDLETTQVIIATPDVIRESLLSSGVRCARVPISGLSRLKLESYSSAHRITLTPSDEIQERSHKKIRICSHRNSSLALCQCKSDVWENIRNGMWSSTVSPYEDRFIDVKFVDNLSGSVNVSVKLEFHRWRVFFLLVGLVLLFLAPIVSSWVPFYYSSSMAIGICLVVIILLFQGMKLFPLGRKNVLYSTICGLAVGAGTFLLNRLSAFVGSILVNFGINEEMHNPVLLFLGVGIVLAGAGFGYWLVRKFVVAEDGSVDVGVAQFVKWALRVIAVTFIFQSTLDIPLAMALLASLLGVHYTVNSLMCQVKRSKVNNYKRAEFLSRRRATNSQGSLWRSPKNSPAWSKSPVKGILSPSGRTPNSHAHTSTSTPDFYSTFHKTPNRKKFSKEEWKRFTEESTRDAVAELASSPEFTDWVIKHADRIQIDRDISSDDESVESGSDSTDEDATQTSSGLGYFRFW